MFDRIPSEISFEWIYFPPFFFTVVFGFVAALVVAKVLNASGLSRVFWHPGLAFVALLSDLRRNDRQTNHRREQHPKRNKGQSWMPENPAKT